MTDKLYVALFHDDEEIQAEGYHRIPVVLDMAVGPGVVSFSQYVEFPMALEDWPKVNRMKILAQEVPVADAWVTEPHKILKGQRAGFMPGSIKMTVTAHYPGPKPRPKTLAEVFADEENK